MTTDRAERIVDLLTDNEATDLARAMDRWQTARGDTPDDLEPIRRALRKRTRRKVAELEERADLPQKIE